MKIVLPNILRKLWKQKFDRVEYEKQANALVVRSRMDMALRTNRA